MSKHIVSVGSIECGSPDLFLISGPCVIEEESLMMTVAEKLKIVSEETGVPMIYKSSFQKDNRSSVDYYQGPGLDEGAADPAEGQGRIRISTHLRHSLH